MYPVYGNPRTGLLRTFWEPDRVPRSPFRGLCVQGLSCPSRRAFLCTLYTETPERASNILLKSTEDSWKPFPGFVCLGCPKLPFDFKQLWIVISPPYFFHDVTLFPGRQKGGFPKGWFWRTFPRNENRNEGTFGWSPGTKTGTGVHSHVPPGTKTGTRAHSPKPPFHETALLSRSELVSAIFLAESIVLLL